MTQLPEPVLDTIIQHGLRETPIAWLQIDASAVLRDLGGELKLFGLDRLTKGAAIQGYAVFLDGILSLGSCEYLANVQIDNGEYADITLLEKNQQHWVILFSCSESLHWQAIAQQKANELRLLQDQVQRFANIEFCNMLGIVVLQKNNNDSFRLLQPMGTNADCFYPQNTQQRDNLQPGQDFPFLSNFIEDCRNVWSGEIIQKLKSGPWIEVDESGQEYALEATALLWQQRKILLIQKLGENYQQHHTTLQHGRENALAKQRLQKLMHQQNTHDELTGFANRALFYEYVRQDISQAEKQEDTLALALLEIENYKEIYQALERADGDLIIKQVTKRLQEVLSGTYKVARLEGHIFSILLSAELESVLQTAMLIQQSMQKLFVIHEVRASLQTCIGIALFPDHGHGVDSLVQKAWVALYMAREHKYGYAVYNPDLDRRSTYRLTLMSELRHAITFNQLALNYQAKVSVQTNTIHSAEALVRWNHPKHGVILPDEFILMAERSRTIQQLSLWVIKQAFTDCAKWHQLGKAIIISINLSTKDLHDLEFPDLIASIQAETKISPAWIIFEITEGSIMLEPKRSLQIISRLHDMGYRFSIDDFGTGYSSLAYLRQLPLVELKIDRSFVQDILTEKNDSVIVNATINLAKNLGLNVVAEGIENAEVMAKLKHDGCDLLQGYYFNKPLSFDDFDIWLSESQWHI